MTPDWAELGLESPDEWQPGTWYWLVYDKYCGMRVRTLQLCKDGRILVGAGGRKWSEKRSIESAAAHLRRLGCKEAA